MWDDGRREEAMGTGSREERQVRGEGKTDPAWFCSAKTSPATGYWCGKERSCVLPAGRLRAAAASLQNSLHCTFREVPAPHSTGPHFPHFPHSGRSSRLHRAVDRREEWGLFSSGVPSGSACTRSGQSAHSASPALSTSQTRLGWSMSTVLEPSSLSGGAPNQHPPPPIATGTDHPNQY